MALLNYDMIDMTSFWSIWFWIVLVIAWSMTAHWTLGVPYDAIVNAERKGGIFAEQAENLAYINAQRIVYYFDKAGVYLIAFICFFIAGIGTAGYYFSVEFFQAMFVLLVPLMLPNVFAVRLAFVLKNQQPTGKDLLKLLFRRRLWNQVIGLFAIILACSAGIYRFVETFRFTY